MSSNVPDYVLATPSTSTPRGSARYSDPLRQTLLDLVLERAATGERLARAVDRPKSTVAITFSARRCRLLRVVRSRRVRVNR